MLNCKIRRLSFEYLCVLIGGDARRLSFRNMLLTIIKGRLSGWKNRNLFLGGRIFLLKSVMPSLHVYVISLFKAPSGLISSIESILIFFLAGEDNRKITWVDWESLCLRKEYGGLEVRWMREFNYARLGKWCWRLMTNIGGLWCGIGFRLTVNGGRILCVSEMGWLRWGGLVCR